jgi:flavodoxin
MKITNPMTHLLLAFFLLIWACSSSQTEDIQANMDATLGPDKVLIVYLSRTNNTKAIAEIIHKNVGGTLVALELEKPYPENYRATVDQVARENETGFLPLLKTRIDSIQHYDVVFIGFPTWGMQLPPPMKSFLKQYDLSGKTIIPFNTNGGYGIGSSFQTVAELCPNSKILEGFTTRGGLERDGQYLVIKDKKAIEAETNVKKWLQKVKAIQVAP